LYPIDITFYPLPVRKPIKSSFCPATKKNLAEEYIKYQDKYYTGNILAQTIISWGTDVSRITGIGLNMSFVFESNITDSINHDLKYNYMYDVT